MPEHNLKKLNAIKYALIIVLSVVGLAAYYFLSRSFVEITVTPPDATLTIDNAPVKLNRQGSKNKTLTPGEHRIKVEAESYNAVEKTINCKRGRQMKVEITLEESAKPSTISEGARILAYGKEKNEIFFLNSAGNTMYKSVLSASKDGSVVGDTAPITSGNLSDINDIVLSPSRELALFKKSDGVYLFDFKKYDFVNQTETLFGRDIGSIAWAPDSSKIAYYYSPPGGEKTLIFSDVTNQNMERVVNFAEIGIENPFLAWSPDSRWLIVISQGASYEASKVLLLDSYSRTFKEVTESGNQIEAAFSPDSQQIIYSTYSMDAENPIPNLLSIMNKDGAEKKSLDLRTRIAEISWVGDFSSLAVGVTDPTSNIDQIVLFDISSKNKSVVFQASDPAEKISRLLVTPDDQIIVYQSNLGIFAINVSGRIVAQ